MQPQLVTAIVTAYKRVDQTVSTLKQIKDCRPLPAEIIVHVDGGQTGCAIAIRNAFPDVQIIVSQNRVGPGGGRNKLIAAAAHNIVASFDDDSYPIDRDYFARLSEVFRQQPDADVVAARITNRGGVVADAKPEVGPAVNFGGGGVAYRRDQFLASGGYVPLAVAYGMEEVDLCLRYLDSKRKIYFSPWLRVFHDNDLSKHACGDVTAGSIVNLALLVYLRYPVRYWPYGAMQVLRRIAWLIMVRRFAGLLSGVINIPRHVWRHRAFRACVSPATLSTFLRERRTSATLRPLTVR